MSKSTTKPNSRQAFAEVFEEHARRFSPLELLGLSSEGIPIPKENRRVLVPDLLVQAPRSDRTVQDQTADPKHLDQTVRPSSTRLRRSIILGQTVRAKEGLLATAACF